MIRFLADADFNHAIVKGCRRQEPAMDFLSANEAALQGVSDSGVLALAAEQGRILVTHDRQTMPQHFGEFLMHGRSSPGMFLVSQHAPIGAVIDELVLIWAASDADEWKDRIVDSSVLSAPTPPEILSPRLERNIRRYLPVDRCCSQLHA